MSIFITGATGHLGSLIVAGLLRKPSIQLILGHRDHHKPEEILAFLKKILSKETELDPAAALNRIQLLPYSALPIPGGRPSKDLRKLEIQEIIHCAGSLEYFNLEALEKVNVGLTRDLLDLGRQLNIRRFIYISTTFSSGFRQGLIPETLHDEPDRDPTDYTRTKRQAEHVVAGYGIPYLIIRPSIAIGDSRDGHYGGKAYGLYQFLEAYERLFVDKYLPIVHVVAPPVPLNMIHQDAFLEGFSSAYDLLPDGSILNLVSKQATLPTVRDIYQIWMEICVRPQEVHYHLNREQVSKEKLDIRLKMLLEISKVNTEISSHPWHFESKNMDWLKERGCPFQDATKKTLRICMQRFADHSPKIKTFLQNNRNNFPQRIQVFDNTSQVGNAAVNT